MITEAYPSFFKSLEKNNSKTWFDEHRKEYENNVRQPFIDLLNELIPFLSDLEPRISHEPKDALFRINRDTRFAKDKTPYNTLMKAGFSPGGRRSELPGFYLGISSEKIHVGGGLFNVKPPQLKAIRNHILNNSYEFQKCVGGQSFTAKFGELKGEKAKRLDVAFRDALDQIPELAHKQFYAMAELPLKAYIGKNIVEVVRSHFTEIDGLNKFLGGGLE